MDSERIDRIARLLADRRSRRSALAGGGFGLVAALVPLAGRVSGRARPDTGGEATPEVVVATPEPRDPHPSADAPARPEMLFVQPFAGGSWALKAGEEGIYTLTLTGAAANTVYFTDRPERIFGLSPTQQFLDGLGFTPANPPNAALVAPVDGGEEEVLVLELLNPVYDEAAGTLTYDATVLADYAGEGLADAARRQTDYQFPEQFAEGGLFLDDCPDDKMDCYANGQVIGWVNVGKCWNASKLRCEHCHNPAGYCASAFPQQCLYRTYDANGNLTGIAYTCEARQHPDGVG